MPLPWILVAICGAPSAIKGAISVDVAVLLCIGLAIETILAQSDSSLVKAVGSGAIVTEIGACRLVLVLASFMDAKL